MAWTARTRRQSALRLGFLALSLGGCSDDGGAEQRDGGARDAPAGAVDRTAPDRDASAPNASDPSGVDASAGSPADAAPPPGPAESNCELEPSFFHDDELFDRGARLELEQLCGDDRCDQTLSERLDGYDQDADAGLCDWPVWVTSGCGVTTVRSRWDIRHYDDETGTLIGAAETEDVFFKPPGADCWAPEFHAGQDRPDCADEQEVELCMPSVPDSMEP